MDVHLDSSFDPFAIVETYIDPTTNYKYYKKQSISKPNENHHAVNIWNYLYGSQQGALLKLPYDAVFVYDNESGKGYDYFPELGIDVPNSECLIACYYAQFALKNLGLYHTDLNNCTNVRKVGDIYYPIDTNKIYPIQSNEDREQQEREIQQLYQQIIMQQQQSQRPGYLQRSGRKRKPKKLRHRKTKKNKTYKKNKSLQMRMKKKKIN